MEDIKDSWKKNMWEKSGFYIIGKRHNRDIQVKLNPNKEIDTAFPISGQEDLLTTDAIDNFFFKDAITDTAKEQKVKMIENTFRNSIKYTSGLNLVKKEQGSLRGKMVNPFNNFGSKFKHHRNDKSRFISSDQGTPQGGIYEYMNPKDKNPNFTYIERNKK